MDDRSLLLAKKLHSTDLNSTVVLPDIMQTIQYLTIREMDIACCRFWAWQFWFLDG